MTDTQLINFVCMSYFTIMGSLGFYLLWREWQWTKKEVDDYEKRAVSAKSPSE